MNTSSATVQGIRPDQEILTKQKLPYFVGISGQTVNATGLSMHLVVIPPGARSEPHLHVGYETGIYVLEGKVLTLPKTTIRHRVLQANQRSFRCHCRFFIGKFFSFHHPLPPYSRSLAFNPGAAVRQAASQTFAKQITP